MGILGKYGFYGKDLRQAVWLETCLLCGGQAWGLEGDYLYLTDHQCLSLRFWSTDSLSELMRVGVWVGGYGCGCAWVGGYACACTHTQFPLVK